MRVSGGESVTLEDVNQMLFGSTLGSGASTDNGSGVRYIQTITSTENT